MKSSKRRPASSHWIFRAKLNPQIFLFRFNGSSVSLLAKILGNFLLSGLPKTTDPMINGIRDKFELGTLAHVPDPLLYFILNFIYHSYWTTSCDGDYKPVALSRMPLSRSHCRQIYELLNSIYSKSFASLNSSILWLGITATPFCAAFVIILQQSAPYSTVSIIMEQERSQRPTALLIANRIPAHL